MSFSTLGLRDPILSTLAGLGYDTPTPIQSSAIPSALAGRDLLASAQTGTGKTAGFTLPLLQRLATQQPAKRGAVRALVLTPTRELADQVGQSVRRYGHKLPLRATEVYGGVNIGNQIRRLRGGVDILVATPGRLIDHMTRGTVDLSRVEVLVMDEADRMLDMGFLPAIERILKTVPSDRQTMLFSATFSPSIRRLAGRFLDSPETISLSQPNSAAEAVSQSAYWVDHARKRELLSYLIGAENWPQVLVFTRTKRGADRLAKQLEADGIRSAAIHGNKSQAARTRALSAFKRQSVRALVATDVAARGLDIDRLPRVVNYDMPDNPEDYVHRIGRTGRAGQEGIAVSLISPAERGQFGAIKRLLDTDIPSGTLAGFDVTERADTARPGRNQNRRSRSQPPRRNGGGRPASRHRGR